MSVTYRPNEAIGQDEWIEMGNLPITVKLGVDETWQGHGSRYEENPNTGALSITRQYMIDPEHGFAHTVVTIAKGKWDSVTIDGIGFDLDAIHAAEAQAEAEQRAAEQRAADEAAREALTLPQGANGNRQGRRGPPTR